MTTSSTGKVPRRAPLTEVIAVAVAGLVDDAREETKREPTHYDLDQWVKVHALMPGDPKANGETVGKRKRTLSALRWAHERSLEAGERAVCALVDLVRGRGGFRQESANFVGTEALAAAQDAFKSEGFALGTDGDLRPTVLDNLSGHALTEALRAYVRRAKAGVEDAALVVGTGKDLLEATAKHVIQVRFNSTPPDNSNFPALLGQAFVAVGLTTPEHLKAPGEPARCDVDRALFSLGCAVNRMRNREGTGHGRPWLPNVTAAEARTAIEAMDHRRAPADGARVEPLTAPPTVVAPHGDRWSWRGSRRLEMSLSPRGATLGRWARP